jgi:hypothetical protein
LKFTAYLPGLGSERWIRFSGLLFRFPWFDYLPLLALSDNSNR